MKKLIANVMSVFSKMFSKEDVNGVKKIAGYRTLKLLPGDCALVIKRNNESFIVENDKTDEEGRMLPNEELLWMLNLYSQNKDYVDILKQMFIDSIEDINSHRVVKESE